jgi:hypothetical protein
MLIKFMQKFYGLRSGLVGNEKVKKRIEVGCQTVFILFGIATAFLFVCLFSSSSQEMEIVDSEDAVMACRDAVQNKKVNKGESVCVGSEILNASCKEATLKNKETVWSVELPVVLKNLRTGKYQNAMAACLVKTEAKKGSEKLLSKPIILFWKDGWLVVS